MKSVNLISEMKKISANILIIDDDEFVGLSLQMLLEQYYSKVEIVQDPTKIVEQINHHKFQLILLDMNFKHGYTSGKEGIYWLNLIHKHSPEASVVMMTAYGEINLAVQTLKEGAVDFITKPWNNDKILATVSAAVSLSFEKSKVDQLEKKQRTLSTENYPEKFVWGISKVMMEVKTIIEKVALTDANVLITGENGTGKERVAKEIHRVSSRSSQIFLSVDLGSLPGNLFESELFGHKKGSFTDAKEERMGRMEAANGGTLFLDEIGNIDLNQQVKLLTAVQKKAIVPLGDNHAKPVDIRIISATNADLDQRVKEKSFREDLFYRLNTIEITVPPLRERKEDIPALAQFYFEKYTLKYQRNLILPPTTIQELVNYQWPGNIRELQHAMERAILLCDSKELSGSDFRLTMNNVTQKNLPGFNLDELEKWAIENALKKCEGNVSHAADELGLSRGALYRRMEKYGL